ncbi:MAG: AlpA family phage regulatory protein [Neptuniibacter sp.]
MGISLYQRFTITEAALFLRCPISEVKKLQSEHLISFIQLTDNQIEFFGYQLLEYLLSNVTASEPVFSPYVQEDRIIRTKEVQNITGLSRTTLWRLERKGEFPARVSLSLGSVGWKLSEVEKWVRGRK